MMRPFPCAFRAIPLLLFSCVLVFWQHQLDAQQVRTLSVADTSSPRDTLRSFIDACNEINKKIRTDGFLNRSSAAQQRVHAKITDCIDLSQIPEYARDYRATEIAVCLKEILDRIDIPEWEEIPDAAAIEKAGGLERLSSWRIPDSRITISRVESGPQKHEYLFSSGTAARAASYYDQVRKEPYRTYGPPVSAGLYKWYFTAPGNKTMASIVQLFPESMQRGRTLGLANWKWPGLALAILVSLGIMIVAFRLQWTLTDRAREKGMIYYIATLIFPIVAMLTPMAFRSFIANFLTIRGLPFYCLSFIATFLVIVAAMVVVFSVANRVAETIIASPKINPRGLNGQLIRIVAKLVSLIGAVIIFLVGGQYLGLAIQTLLASAGIFGAAVALAAQDVIKGIFGTLTVLSDKPFKVGERIMFDKYDGTIEDIGLRSTRMRLLTGNLVTIPNERLAADQIENVTNRRSLRRRTVIHLPLDTESKQVEQAVSIIRNELENHEGMDPAFPPRVFFDEFDSDSLTILVFYWFSPPNYWAFKEFGEKFNFSIFKEFEKRGIQFSIPLRHSFWNRESESGLLKVQMTNEQNDGND